MPNQVQIQFLTYDLKDHPMRKRNQFGKEQEKPVRLQIQGNDLEFTEDFIVEGVQDGEAIKLFLKPEKLDSLSFWLKRLSSGE